MHFYVGVDDVCNAKHFARVFISVNRLRSRKAPIGAAKWIMDSGAFTEISTHGRYRHGVEQYAEVINRWSGDPALVAVVAQDYMCEPWIISKTGLSVAEHQRLTIERVDGLRALTRAYVMPVLQGFEPRDYVRHVKMYGERLPAGAYVGVGSVCKRNTNIHSVEQILLAIKHVRPDLRLHGFGVKITSLASGIVRNCLESADSMAWSHAARWEGRNQHDWREAAAFVERIETQHVQHGFGFMEAIDEA